MIDIKAAFVCVYMSELGMEWMHFLFLFFLWFKSANNQNAIACRNSRETT